MSRRRKIVLIATASLAGLFVALFLAAIVVVQTDWFRNTVRGKIISAVEDSTGGRVEIGSFAFDWTHLRAVVRDFTVHGTEPQNVAPLFHANLLEVDLKLTSPFRSFIDIAYLGVDTPRANLIVDASGRSNIPTPKVQSTSSKSGLATIVDLAVGSFRLTNGRVELADHQTNFDANGQNLRAHLTYSMLTPRYSGDLAMTLLLAQTGQPSPLSIDIDLPVQLERDQIRLTNARLTTAESQVLVSGTMSHLAAPRTAAQLNAKIALDEIARFAGPSLALAPGPNLPRYLTAELAGSMDDKSIDLSSGRITLGQSQFEASGAMKGGGSAGLRFNANLALGQLGRLLKVTAQPEGTVLADGTAKLTGDSDYQVTAKLDAHGLSLREGTTRLTGINLNTSVSANPRLIELTDLKASALGGTLTGGAKLEQMARFQANLQLSAMDIQNAARALSPQRLPWDGVISGPIDAAGDIREPQNITARVRLAIAPGHRGIPVSGRILASYDGRAGNVDVGQSYIALPSSRLDLSGSLGKRIQLRLVSRNLNDLLAGSQPPPVVLQNGGSATVTAVVTGSLSAPHITGHVDASNFAVENRAFDKFSADLDASKTGAAVQNAALSRGALEAQFSGSVGLRDWKPESYEPLAAQLSIKNADAQDLLALAGQANPPLTGLLNASANIAGTLGSPRGSASLNLANGSAYQEHFDQLDARLDLTDRAVNLTSLRVTAGGGALNANASYQHPVNNLKQGSIKLHLDGDQIALQRLQAVKQAPQGLAGTLKLLADATANVTPDTTGESVEVTSVNGNVAAHGLAMQGKALGDFTARAQTSGTQVSYNIDSNFAGSTVKVTGESSLTGNHETKATASIARLPIDRVLAVAGRRELPLAGVFDGNAEVSGTLSNPQGTADFTVTRGTAYGEPFDRLTANLKYTGQLLDLHSLTVAQGANRIEASASLAHPPNNLQAGQARFHLTTNSLNLAQLPAVQKQKPGLAGTVELSGDGAAELRPNATPLVSSLNASLAARSLSLNQQSLGDLTATARTSNNSVIFDLNSNFAKSNIRGNGQMQLAGDYPLQATVTFDNVTYSGISALLNASTRPNLEALLAGKIDIHGPAAKPEAMDATLQVSTLNLHTLKPAVTGSTRTVDVRNAEPIVIALHNSTVNIQSARLTGSDASLNLSGTASLAGAQSLNLHADGNLNLAILQAFDADIFSSGHVTLNANVKGAIDQPQIAGRLQMRDAAFNMLDVPNGLSKGNGTVVFDGKQARIQNLSGETGGGTITMTGFVGYGGPDLNFHLQANGKHVHVDYPAGVNTEANLAITLEGTSARSLVRGNITVMSVALHSHTDAGSILSQAAAPPSASTADTGILAGMRLDVRIDTSPNIQFDTALAQNLQADGHLTLRGTPANPGILGRINVSEGELIFFGSKYTIDQGSVAFYNPSKIEPMLNLDLETEAKGVTVSLNVSGPIDQLKLTYHSDPPLQFSDLSSSACHRQTAHHRPRAGSHPARAGAAKRHPDRRVGRLGPGYRQPSIRPPAAAVRRHPA